MASTKRQRNNNPRLSTDLLLAIAVRSDARTIVRCAATCKALRRDILDPSFIRQAAAGVVPTCILLAYTRRRRRCNHRRKPFVSLVHPATPIASCFTDKHLAPFVSRSAADDLLGRYDPFTSRGGLIVLRRRHYGREPENSDLCVYDPMTGRRTFLSRPPGLSADMSTLGSRNHPCVLLTTADGIGCSSFMLFVADWDWSIRSYTRFLRVQTAAPSDAGDPSWGPDTMRFSSPFGELQDNRDAVVLPGGSIHWLLGNDILVYHVATEKLCTLKLPFMATMNEKPAQRHLGMSPDGRLRFLVVDRLMITMWMQLPSGHGLKQEAVIDTKEKLRLLEPNILLGNVMIEFERSGERNGAVLMRLYRRHRMLSPGPLIILELETKEMRRQGSCPSFLFEVDMFKRLEAMKIFS